MRDKEEQEQAK